MARRVIDPGRLRIFARLERATLVADEAGGHHEIWDTLATIPMSVEPVAATSAFSADQLREAATHRAVFRARGDVESGMRFAVGARRLAILTIQDADETGRHLVALLRETGR